MVNLLRKEMRLSSSPLTYYFILFGLIPFFPGYPILIGGFFLCLGLFQSFQAARESNDIVYSALLPVSKSDVVKSKYIFCVFIEMCGFVLSAGVTLIRMTLLCDVPAYRNNALMNANPAYLGFLLLILGSFNAIFVCGFFATAYKFAKPFIIFTTVSFLIVGIGETLHHIPALAVINAFGFEQSTLQFSVLAAGTVVYLMLTLFSFRKAVALFDKIDL